MTVTLQTWISASVVLGAVSSALVIAGVIGRPLRRLTRQGDEFRQDWYGTPARPGRAAIPGVPARLAAIEAEMHPNHGGSLRDAVDRVEARQIRTDQRLDQHLTVHDRT